MKKSRLLALTVHLLNHKHTSAPALARRFEVSERTIYRDLEALSQAGIPVAAVQGRHGGISLSGNYSLSRQTLSPDAAASLIAALESVKNTFADPELALAVEKIRSLVPEQHRGRLDAARNRIIFNTNPWGSRDREELLFQELYQALLDQHPVSLSYLDSAGKATERMVEPMTLVFQGFAWFLFGWCRARSDYRLFKLSRIRGLTVDDSSFERKTGTWVDCAGSFAAPELVEITLRFRPECRHRALEYFDTLAGMPDAEGFTTISARMPAGEWLTGFILGMGSGVEVLSPSEVRGALRQSVTMLKNIYDRK